MNIKTELPKTEATETESQGKSVKEKRVKPEPASMTQTHMNIPKVTFQGIPKTFITT